MTTETTRTAKHEYMITDSNYAPSFLVTFRPLHPKTGEPWQASHRVEQGADVTPAHWTRPITFSTIEAARAAVAADIARRAK